MSERAPTDQELEEEDRRRGEVTVQELLDMDLADPETPSRRWTFLPAADDPGGEAIEGMEIPGLRDWADPDQSGNG